MPGSATESRTYKKSNNAEEVRRWSVMYPWYASFIGDIKESLRDMDRKRSESKRDSTYSSTETSNQDPNQL